MFPRHDVMPRGPRWRINWRREPSSMRPAPRAPPSPRLPGMRSFRQRLWGGAIVVRRLLVCARCVTATTAGFPPVTDNDSGKA